MKTKTLVTIILWGIIIIMLYYSWFGRENHYRHLMKHGKQGIGTVDVVGIKTYDISIDVAGRSYKMSKSIPDADFFTSEQFQVFYNENDPGDFEVALSHPVIDLHTYDFDSTLPTKVQKVRLSPGRILFWYKVNGKVYRRAQSVDNTEYWKNLQNVWVVFRVGRPEIGYLVRKE
jgi:hypothetical protein